MATMRQLDGRRVERLHPLVGELFAEEVLLPIRNVGAHSLFEVPEELRPDQVARPVALVDRLGHAMLLFIAAIAECPVIRAAQRIARARA